jgi:DNA-binding HxlR family transcriptional regulator
MLNNGICGESSKKVLNILLQNPSKFFAFVQFRKVLGDMSESGIRESLRELENKRVLKVSQQRGKPAGKGSDKLSIIGPLRELENKRVLKVSNMLNTMIEQ